MRIEDRETRRATGVLIERAHTDWALIGETGHRMIMEMASLGGHTQPDRAWQCLIRYFVDNGPSLTNTHDSCGQSIFPSLQSPMQLYWAHHAISECVKTLSPIQQGGVRTARV